MCFRRDATRRIGSDVHVIAITHRMDSGHRQTHLGPESGDDQLLPAGLLHRLNDAAVLRPSSDSTKTSIPVIFRGSLGGPKPHDRRPTPLFASPSANSENAKSGNLRCTCSAASLIALCPT